MVNETEIKLTKKQLLQLSLSVSTRLGVVQTRWASAVLDEKENNGLLVLMNELVELSKMLDDKLRQLNEEN